MSKFFRHFASKFLDRFSKISRLPYWAWLIIFFLMFLLGLFVRWHWTANPVQEKTVNASASFIMVMQITPGTADTQVILSRIEKIIQTGTLSAEETRFSLDYLALLREHLLGQERKPSAWLAMGRSFILLANQIATYFSDDFEVRENLVSSTHLLASYLRQIDPAETEYYLQEMVIPAQQLAKDFPKEAEAQMLLAQILATSSFHSRRQEIADHFQRCLDINPYHEICREGVETYQWWLNEKSDLQQLCQRIPQSERQRIEIYDYPVPARLAVKEFYTLKGQNLKLKDQPRYTDEDWLDVLLISDPAGMPQIALQWKAGLRALSGRQWVFVRGKKALFRMTVPVGQEQSGRFILPDQGGWKSTVDLYKVLKSAICLHSAFIGRPGGS